MIRVLGFACFGSPALLSTETERGWAADSLTSNYASSSIHQSRETSCPLVITIFAVQQPDLYGLGRCTFTAHGIGSMSQREIQLKIALCENGFKEIVEAEGQ